MKPSESQGDPEAQETHVEGRGNIICQNPQGSSDHKESVDIQTEPLGTSQDGGTPANVRAERRTIDNTNVSE